MANDINSAELCLNAIQSLEEQLRGARKTLINSETCVVNRSIMSARLEYLKDNLPKTVEIAAKIVAEEETIRTETEQKRTEILESANAQAQNMVKNAAFFLTAFTFRSSPFPKGSFGRGFAFSETMSL